MNAEQVAARKREITDNAVRATRGYTDRQRNIDKFGHKPPREVRNLVVGTILAKANAIFETIQDHRDTKRDKS